MNLLQLRYFTQLAYTKHYTQAAEQLCITQPSLSHAISQLEAELGVPLFEKVGRKNTLTCFGEQFLSCAESTLKTLDGGIDAIRRRARGEGTIRLGLLRFLGMEFIPKLTQEFLSRQSDIDIHFTFQTGVTQTLLDGLSDNHYDLVFSSKPQINTFFTAEPIAQQKLVLVVPKGHPLSGYESIDLEQTLIYPYVFFSETSGLRIVIDSLFDKIGKLPNIAYEVEEDQMVAGLVAGNFGIGILPEMNFLNTINVDTIKIKSPVVERNIYMVSNNRIYMPPVVQNFSEFVLEKCRTNKWLTEQSISK